ncbi:RAB5B, member ras oncogene family, isoform CRA_b, partial [Phakopsora pachyrhizi]
SQLEAKVVILGMQGVGKTSIVHRYTTGSFSYSLTSTIGASFCTKKLSVDGCKVRLQIWDTAGQERFRSMAPMYYRGANAAILVYDLTNQESFSDIQNWIDELRQNMTSDLIIQIVGSKADLAHDRRAVDLDEGLPKHSEVDLILIILDYPI